MLSLTMRSQHLDTKRYNALSSWSKEVKRLHNAIVGKASQTGPGSLQTGPGSAMLPIHMGAFSRFDEDW
jgi:hypothetical protein